MEKLFTLPFTLTATVVGIFLTILATPLTIQAVQNHYNPKPTSATNITNNYTTVPAPTNTDTPTIQTTDAKLEAVITEYAKTHSGMYSVAVTELNKTHTTYNADEPTITASTYKTFAAYTTIKQIETGTLAWDSYTNTGYTVDYCFTIMLTESNNECAEALLEIVSMTQTQQDAWDIGATETTFEPYNIHSTANNLNLLLTKLATGNLPISQENQAKWIDTMTSNIYRQGIPAGINPNPETEQIKIADKVGFQDNLLHDTAIIYSPKGTYILTILTTDASWENIAELANLIETNR